MNKIIIGILAIVILVGGGVWWSKSIQSKPTQEKVESDILTQTGLHWHTLLEIYVRGEKQTIPADIGIGGEFSTYPMGMAPIHTHSDANQGTIHLEFDGVVKKEDTTLGQFFKSWNKNINSFGTLSSMTVNGVENSDPVSYEMKDGDKIVLRYE
jgi:hypothetical protein